MKIAVTCENGFVFQHFGHTPEFAVYDCENGQIVSSRIVSSGDSVKDSCVRITTTVKVMPAVITDVAAMTVIIPAATVPALTDMLLIAINHVKKQRGKTQGQDKGPESAVCSAGPSSE